MEQKTKLLLAEDDENLGLLLKEYLVAKGYDVELYPDGEAAYKGFMREHYDICILDIMMPKKDGFTLAKDIRIVNAEIPVIFLTAKNLKEDVIEEDLTPRRGIGYTLKRVGLGVTVKEDTLRKYMVR